MHLLIQSVNRQHGIAINQINQRAIELYQRTAKTTKKFSRFEKLPISLNMKSNYDAESGEFSGLYESQI